MNIDLSGFHDETVSSIHIEGKLEKNTLDINGRRIKFIEPIRYEGEIYKVNGDRLLHININYKYEEACGRCLESFIKEENTVLSGKLVKKTDKITEAEEDDEEAIYYEGENLDLSQYIMSMVILSLPMKPLCDEKCKGLCPKCGTNHNKEECDCVVEDIDPRLAKLKDFFPEK